LSSIYYILYTVYIYIYVCVYTRMLTHARTRDYYIHAICIGTGRNKREKKRIHKINNALINVTFDWPPILYYKSWPCGVLDAVVHGR